MIFSEMYMRELLGVTVPVIRVTGTPVEYTVFDLAMDAAGATELGKHDWRIALEAEGDGEMRLVRIGGRWEFMFCVSTLAMSMTLIHIATMPQYSWMAPDKRAALAAVGRGTLPSALLTEIPR